MLELSEASRSAREETSGSPRSCLPGPQALLDLIRSTRHAQVNCVASIGFDLAWIKIEVIQTPCDDSDSFDLGSLEELRYKAACREV